MSAQRVSSLLALAPDTSIAYWAHRYRVVSLAATLLLNLCFLSRAFLEGTWRRDGQTSSLMLRPFVC